MGKKSTMKFIISVKVRSLWYLELELGLERSVRER